MRCIVFRECVDGKAPTPITRVSEDFFVTLDEFMRLSSVGEMRVRLDILAAMSRKLDLDIAKPLPMLS